MKKWMLAVMFIFIFSASLLSACGSGSSQDDQEKESAAQEEKKQKEEPEELNEYGITDEELESFVNIYKKFPKDLIESYMERVSTDDPHELFMKNLPVSLEWATAAVDLAEEGIYSLEDMEAYTKTIEHYNDGYVFEHAVIEWREKEDISDEKWKQLMDNHIMGEMDFIKNVMRPAYMEVYDELMEEYQP